MEMILANMPDINAVQQFNSTSAPSPEADAQISDSGESKFADIVKKEINNNEVIDESEKTETVSDNRTSCKSIEEIAFAVIPAKAGIQKSLVLKNTGFPIKTSGMTNKDFCKSLNILLYMRGSQATSNINGLPAILINEIKDQEATEDVTQQLMSQEVQNIIGKEGLQVSVINEITDQETTEESPQQLKNPEDQNMPAEKDLKMGALLYAINNTSINPTGDSHTDLINQSNSDTKTKGKTFNGEIKSYPEQGLKTGTLLSGARIENINPPLPQFNKEGVDKDSAEKSLPAPAHNEINKTVPESSKLFAVEKLIEHFDKNNKNELNRLKSDNIRQDLTNSALTENNSNSKNLQSGLSPEIAKEIDKVEGFKYCPDKSVKTLIVESTADNTNLLNNSSIALENGKLTQGISSGNAARTSGFHQILDTIVYVVKGNSNLGVTIEHDSLGKLNINLNMDKGVLNVHINTSEKTVREFIENNVQYIVDSLAKDGVSVGGFSVSLKDHKDHEGNVPLMSSNNAQEKEIIKEESRITAISGLVSLFA